MPSTCTGATDSLVFGFWRWSAWMSATPYRTSAPGRLMVLIRPPSLEPSTPDVREPRAWVTPQSVRVPPLSPSSHPPPPPPPPPARAGSAVRSAAGVFLVSLHL